MDIGTVLIKGKTTETLTLQLPLGLVNLQEGIDGVFHIRQNQRLDLRIDDLCNNRIYSRIQDTQAMRYNICSLGIVKKMVIKGMLSYIISVKIN